MKQYAITKVLTKRPIFKPRKTMYYIAICKEKAIFLVQKYFIIPGKNR